ncbi:diaminopimelate decarboxylase [Ponticaulis koreensis]|uniref:diaminopimelate decarboxylase n=1 Tax=Ponticaulis koreensis TaxID=1123045 RepID=UPI0003B55E31|nr:diaminopimelate decarboxylase [Ponticaulis koreensis]
MHHFEYRDSVLHCEDISVSDIAERFGTPVYIYSSATLTRHYKVLADAFKDQPCLIAYAMKANSNQAVLATLAALGSGADVVSGGEMKRAMAVGIPANKIVFSGVAKSRTDILDALEAGIHQFNVESLPELHRISELANANGYTADIAFRINPHVEAGGHANISTGGAEHKFGIAWHEGKDFYTLAQSLPGINVCGVDVHIGSQITNLDPLRAAFEKVVGLVRDLREAGVPITRMDLGGGLGIPYRDGDEPATPAEYAAMVREVLGDLDVEVILEPGRMIAGNAGIFVSRVEYIKERDGRRFAILDAGMNDLMRPALYQAVHEMKPVVRSEGRATLDYDIVGPICESTDRFAKNYPAQEMNEGDLVAFMSAGAYGAVMSNQYNTRPMCAEVLVNGDNVALIRTPPTFEEIIASETVPEWLKT